MTIEQYLDKINKLYNCICNSTTDQSLNSSFDNSNVFAFYSYPENETQETEKTTPDPSRGGEFGVEKLGVGFGKLNLNPKIVKQIADKLGLTFVPKKRPNSPPPEGCPKDGVVTLSPQEKPSKNKILTTIHGKPIYRNFVENLPYNPALKPLLKDKRKAGILSEVLFWQQVHKGIFHKIDFDRQRIIGNYIVDFYVKTLGLVIEIDGSSHDNKGDYDAKRQAYLESLGLKVYRITDLDVKKRLVDVMSGLERYIVDEYGVGDSFGVGEETTPPFRHPSKGGEFDSFWHPSKEEEFESFRHPSEEGEFASIGGELASIDILDYIYAVLHSPSFREKYKEFLKIDFPRVPYPKDAATFWQLVSLGGEIRQIHFLERETVEKYLTEYPIDGDNVVGKPRYEQRNYVVEESPDRDEIVISNNDTVEPMGRVHLNETQYFDNVPEVAWNFYIGGYQPAQKWLKDRKGRALEFEDILHYQKIIFALSETDRLMKEIDKIEIE